MATEDWISAASKTHREPVLLMTVESVDAIKQAITTREDWEAGSVKTNIVTNSALDNPGVVIMSTDGTEVHSGTYPGPPVNVANYSEDPQTVPVYEGSEGDYYVTETVGPVVSGGDSRTVSAVFTIHREYASFLIDLGTPNTFQIQGSRNGGTYAAIYTFTASTIGDIVYSVNLTKGTWSFRLVCTSANLGIKASIKSVVFNHQTYYLPTATTTTKSIDLGATPTSNSIFGVKDVVSDIATLTYTAYGSDDNSTWTSLGTVVDGSSLAPYRYYRFKADFTSTGPDTPILEEINITGGNSQFRYFSTHEDVPVSGARPLLKNNLGALSSRLDLMKLGTTGEVGPKMFYLRDTFEILRDGELRNKTVSVKMGFVGLPESSYEPLFAGLWYDASIDHIRAEISVKTRTIISRFQKAQVPAERATGTSRSDDNVTPKEWINVNIITAMLDVIDYIGIASRWIDAAAADDIRTGARSGSDWLVSRRLDKDNKADAVKLLEELSVLSGVFTLQLPDGRMGFKLYDPAAATVAEITNEICTFSTVDLGQGELYTRQQIFYEPRHEGDLETGNARGEYATGVDYARNDSVTVSGVTWFCLQSHQSATVTAPGTGAAHRAYWTTEWQASTSYALGDVRIVGGPLYTCKEAHTSSASSEPGRGSDWRTYWVTQPSSPGDSDEDYHSAYILINDAAEIAWGLNEDLPGTDPDYRKNPGYQRKFYDKWSATPAARAALALRMDSWFATPKMRLKASNLPPRYWCRSDGGEMLGEFVGVTGLVLPTAGAEWGVPCVNKKFMVMSKTFDPVRCTVSFDLLEV